MTEQAGASASGGNAEPGSDKPRLRGGVLRRWLSEPLVGFAAIGLLLFGLDAWRRQDQGHVIQIGQAEEERLATLWYGQMQRQPSAQELDRLVEEYVREEVMVREARRRGLDQDDVIVRRRLEQKLSFLLEDSSSSAAPDQRELEAYFERHRERYQSASRVSFQHVYVSRSLRGNQADEVANSLLAELERTSGKEWRALGDPFMLLREYADRAGDEVAGDFGGEFAATLFTLPVGSWSGPVSSALGIHLVLIRSRHEPGAAKFDEVRERVAEDWRNEDRLEANELAYQKLRGSYRVIRAGKVATR